MTMKRYRYHIVGVMSGTSLDGIDLVHVEFNYQSNQERPWSFILKQCQTIPYSPQWVQTLKQAVDYSPEELEILNERYTVYLAGVIQDFILKHKLEALAGVCSHGHTILHRPDLGYTLQIGNLPILADLINQVVVCDFRTNDVALQGQGAPLVPIGDKLLFAQYQGCLNLGGFANISFLSKEGKMLAFDICAVNIVLNYLVSKIGLAYDNHGDLARKGVVNQELLSKFNSLNFYSDKGPKSLGLEYVKQNIYPVLDNSNLSLEDMLCTFVEHIAMQVAHVLQDNNIENLLVSGGGFYNTFLIERLVFYAPNVVLSQVESNIVEFKEAIIFGLLGVLALRKEINVLSSVTGATRDHCSGKIYYPYAFLH